MSQEGQSYEQPTQQVQSTKLQYYLTLNTNAPEGKEVALEWYLQCQLAITRMLYLMYWE